MASKKENSALNRTFAEVDLFIRGRTDKACLTGTIPIYYLYRHLKRRGFSKKYRLEVDSSYCIMYITRGKLEVQIFLNGEDAFSRGFTMYPG